MASKFSYWRLLKIEKGNSLGCYKASIHTLNKIGKREIVGYGLNGSGCYYDCFDSPMPGIRFKEPNSESICLRAKEQLNWNKLSILEKKALYRHSFCQTFSEMKAPSTEWKLHIGLVLLAISCGIWVSLLMNAFVYDDLPISFDEEHQKAQLKRMLDLEVNPIHGISSKWDYENKKWK